MTDTDRADMDELASRMAAECPWSTCSGVLDHTGWLDVVETIRTVYPAEYASMVRQERERMESPWFRRMKGIVRGA